ncbi:flagellar hook capping FlgD N-terminal domain-containing protein [Paenibacillus polymyxa]|uniref:flagellar hook capping FlgD N-terminal domain-containing protein n=1 Tax=Paenibacillus polymyxa TaxID=1406 RepID=UPI000589CB68|nr:flagellar hook capping FlgD N-terminal domain-containing protein [Paenibacillus polymyxa]AJE49979.1 flagellar hook capping protein [Paenibacillus polymyxa]QOH61646.1 flagellar hook capping protein [Paenibacillus polymyxa]
MTTTDNNVSTSNVWPNYNVNNVKTASAKDTKTMGKDQFLKILITQLQNQDPMQPLEDKEFVAQMAQFSSVEQLMNISTQLTALGQSLGTASGLIGKEVSWIEPGKKDSITGEAGAGTVKSGIVDSIVIRDGVQYAKMGAAEVALKDVTSVSQANTTAPVTETSDTSSSSSTGSGENS